MKIVSPTKELIALTPEIDYDQMAMILTRVTSVVKFCKSKVSEL
jgi:hypothetical protein